MNKFTITIFSLLTLSVAQALAQNTNQPVDNQPSSDWFQTVFSDLWMACIERDAGIQYIEHTVQPNTSAKALYRTWVNNACTVPGKEHYYNVKPGYGSPAEVSPVIYGPPEIEGKPILSPAEGISLMLLIRNRHEHLYNYARDYVREPSGKMHESAKKAIVEMCGIEAVEKLDASLTKRKQTESAIANSIESNWYKHEFSVLWQSHIEKDPEINHFEEKLIPNKSAKTLYRTWVTNLCVTPGEKPYIAVTARDGHSPNIVPAFHGSPKADGKPILSPMDAATAQFTVELNHDRLETAYRNFIGEATEDKRLHAKRTLVEMCGAEAVARLDASLTMRKKTRPADVSSIDSNWYYNEYRVLWQSLIERDPDIIFLEQKTLPDKRAKALYKTWVTNACTTPGQEHYSYIKPGYGFPADVASTYYGPPKLDGKPILKIAEAITLYQIVKTRNDHLFSNYREYVYSDSNENRAKAKEILLEMCGEAAVEQLDEELAKYKTKEQL